jgi:antitoxin component YwqK of YwqJK toxin-antitoxin module
MHWYENGQLMERGTFQVGIPNGAFESRSPGGVVTAAGSYKDGEREGAWRYSSEDGTLDALKSGLYAGDVRTGDLPPEAAAPAEQPAQRPGDKEKAGDKEPKK